jgi:hypothetical protein
MATAAGLKIVPETGLGRYEAAGFGLMAERTVLGLMVDVDSIGEVRKGRRDRIGFGRPVGL